MKARPVGYCTRGAGDQKAKTHRHSRARWRPHGVWPDGRAPRPELTATNATAEPFRIVRLAKVWDRVLLDLAHHPATGRAGSDAARSRMLAAVGGLHDHKGELTISWNLPGQPHERQAV